MVPSASVSWKADDGMSRALPVPLLETMRNWPLLVRTTPGGSVPLSPGMTLIESGIGLGSPAADVWMPDAVARNCAGRRWSSHW